METEANISNEGTIYDKLKIEETSAEEEEEYDDSIDLKTVERKREVKNGRVSVRVLRGQIKTLAKGDAIDKQISLLLDDYCSSKANYSSYKKYE